MSTGTLPIRAIRAKVEQMVEDKAALGYAGHDQPTFVRCEVEVEGGLVGTGVTGRFLASEVRSLLSSGFAEELIGADARAVEALRARLDARFNRREAGSVFVSALSCVDIALWDLRGQALGQPVWRLLGGARESVDVYATVGLPGFDEQALVKVCQEALGSGYHGVKILVAAGGRSVSQDARRVRIVREAIGPDAELMIDANCGMTLPEAKRLCALVADCNIKWFEEPILRNDIEALAELRRSTPVPIAAGQMVQLPEWYRAALTRGAVDWLHVNAVFCGGISAMTRILALAESHCVPVAQAGGWDFPNLSVMAGHAHGGLLEMHASSHMQVRERLTNPLLPEGGRLAAPSTPGIGFAFADRI